MDDTILRYRIGVMLALTALLGHAVFYFMSLAPFGVDDANILFVYSKHFANGEGLVYNIGGERVEGFTSMLWMVLTSLPYLFVDRPYPIYLALNLFFVGSALGYALHFVASRFSATKVGPGVVITLPGVIFIAWVASNPSYFLWTVTSMMETGFWSALLIFTAIYLLGLFELGRTPANAPLVFALLLAALILTRPEGIAWALSFATLFFVLQRSHGAPRGELLRGTGFIIAVGAVTFFGLMLFRLGYFGFPWPNTYYVKVTPDKFYNLRFGVIYFLQFVQASSFVILCIVAAAFSVLRNSLPVIRVLLLGDTGIDRSRLAEFSASCFVLVGMLLPVLMGGDIFGAFRFFQPVWPLLVIVLFYLLPERWWLVESQSHIFVVCVTALIVFTTTHWLRWPSLSEDRARVGHLYELSDRGMQTGAYLEQLFASRRAGLPTVSWSAAGGKIGYAGNVLDTMGLNFTPMAHHDGDKKGTRGHAAFDKDVFWLYATDLFEPTLCPRNAPPVNRYKNENNWIFEIYRGLPGDERFQSEYSFVAIDVPDSTDKVCTYIRTGLRKELSASDAFSWQIVN